MERIKLMQVRLCGPYRGSELPTLQQHRHGWMYYKSPILESHWSPDGSAAGRGLRVQAAVRGGGGHLLRGGIIRAVSRAGFR